MKGQSVRKHACPPACELTTQCGRVEPLRSAAQLRTLAWRQRPTRDDVILRQGLRVLLLPLALHHTQHGPPARSIKERICSFHWRRKKILLFVFLSEPGVKTLRASPIEEGFAVVEEKKRKNPLEKQYLWMSRASKLYFPKILRKWELQGKFGASTG